MDNSKHSFSSEDVEVRKGPWTMEEDLILINYIATHGEGVWNTLAKSAGLKRTGKSCRLRWLNYLRPDVRRGNITPEEQLLIMELHAKWGNRWSKIAKHLPGRTDNEIKNFWRTRIQKSLKQGGGGGGDHHHHQQNSSGQSSEQAAGSTSQLSTSGSSHAAAAAAAHDPYTASSYPEAMDTGGFPAGFFLHHHQQPAAACHPPPPLPSPVAAAGTEAADQFWSMDADLWSMQFFNGDQGRLT